MKQYKTIKLPQPAYDTLEELRARLAQKGIQKLPDWASSLLMLTENHLTKGALVSIGIIALALTLEGKTEEEIRQMSPDEVKDVLRQCGYKLPPEWERE